MRDLLARTRGIRIVGIGGSAGAIEALQGLLPTLRPEWNLAFAIVLHRQPVEVDERLESLLNSWSGIPVTKAREGQAIVVGEAVVAPADVHLVVTDGYYHLTTSAKENRVRPSLDVTFRSIASHCGAAGGAIVLSGMLDDGAAGIRTVRESGGLTIAQDPDEAIHSGMPQSAIKAGATHVSTISGMTALLETFARAQRREIRAFEGAANEDVTRLTCPDCGGVLLEGHEDDFPAYRCRVGHRFSPETLHAAKGGEIESALWSAIQVLEEQVDFTERVARRARSRGNDLVAERMRLRAQRYRERAETVRGALPRVAEAIGESEDRARID